MNTILIVDPDPLLGKLLEGRLTAFGFVVQVISDAQEAVSVIAQQQPDLCLSELVWVDCSPVDWVSRLVQTSPRTAIIALTQLEDPVTVVGVFEAGVCDYVVKPFDFRTLLDKVQQLSKISQSQHP